MLIICICYLSISVDLDGISDFETHLVYILCSFPCSLLLSLALCFLPCYRFFPLFFLSFNCWLSFACVPFFYVKDIIHNLKNFQMFQNCNSSAAAKVLGICFHIKTASLKCSSLRLYNSNKN
jgi:hypothetical protein